jgi:hypothetical protein
MRLEAREATGWWIDEDLKAAQKALWSVGDELHEELEADWWLLFRIMLGLVLLCTPRDL